MKRVICFASIALMVVSMSSFVAVGTAMAETHARGTAKARGDYSTNYWGQSAGRSVQHARDYSRGYQSYARQVPNVLPEIARQEAKGVGQNITAAQKQFGELRKATTDKETLKSLDLIDKQLAEAVKAHQLMDEMCKMRTIDGVGTMKCCEDIEAALAKAFAEHQKMMERFEGEMTTAVKN